MVSGERGHTRHKGKHLAATLEECSYRIDHVVFVVDYGDDPPFVEGGTRVRDAAHNAISDTNLGIGGVP